MKVRRIANASCLLLSLTVSSLSPARAAQSAQAGDQQSLAAIQAACAEDAQKLCAGVQPGGGRIVACLREHKDSLSDRCKKAAGLTANPSNSSAPSSSSGSPASETPATSAPAAPTDPPRASSARATPAAKSSHGADAAPKVAARGTASGSYLRMKQVQVIAKVVDAALGSGTSDIPAMDLLIPFAWDFKSSVAGNTTEGCFSDFYAVSWEATSGDGSVAFQGAPNDSWQYTDDPAELRKMTDPNRRALGLQGKPCPVKKPMKAEDYFRQNVLSAFPQTFRDP